MVKHLYEVAVLTPFTKRHGEQNDAKTDELSDNRSSSNWSQGFTHGSDQLQTDQSWTQATSWNIESGQELDTASWTSAASLFNLSEQFTEYPWFVENGKSVSSFSSQGSISSWGGRSDLWSSDSCGSFSQSRDDSLEASSRRAEIIDVTFDSKSTTSYTPLPLFNPTRFSATLPKSEKGVAQADKAKSNDHLEQMLARVAQDLVALEVKDPKEIKWQTPFSSSVVDKCVEQRYDSNKLLGREVFPSSRDGLNHGQGMGFDRKDFLTASDKSANEFSNSVQCEVGNHRRSVLDSGQVSRCSSVSSLIATSSNASEENLADVESCEDNVQLKNRKLKRKLKNEASIRGVFIESELPSMTNAQESETEGLVKDSSILNSEHGLGSNKSTSGYTESAGSQSLSSDSDVFELNPNCKPFFPRAYTNPSVSTFQYYPATTQDRTVLEPINSVWNPAICQANYSDAPFIDSGVGNTTNLTRTWDTTYNTTNNTGIEFCGSTFNDTTYHSEIFSSFCDDTFDLQRKNQWTDTSFVKVPNTEEIPPYDCRIDHGSEFTPIQDFSVQKLPLEYQTWDVLNAVLTISQRVVRLKVTKPFKTTLNPTRDRSEVCASEKYFMREPDLDADAPCFDHYGTGFTCHVDTERLIVRTHSAVVSNAKEASNTEVTFLLTFPDRSQSPLIRCFGQSEGFSSSDFSQNVKFICRTPQELVPFLSIFKSFPIVRRASLFNDSCYFTESSQNSSISERDDVEGSVSITQIDPQEQIHATETNHELENKVETVCHLQRDKGKTSSLPMEALLGDSVDCSTQTNQQHNRCSNSNLTNGDSQAQVIYSKKNHSLQKFVSFHGCQNSEPQHQFESDNSFSIRADTSRMHTTSNPLTVEPKTTNAWSQANEQFWPQIFEPAITLPGNPQEPDLSQPPWHSLDRQQLSDPRPLVSNIQRLQKSVPSQSSPLLIMEGKYASTNRHHVKALCPYTGQNIFGDKGTYSNFSSFAGDVFSSFAAVFTPANTPLPGEQSETERWEYERLIYLQDHHRDTYNFLNGCTPGRRGTEWRGSNVLNTNQKLTSLDVDFGIAESACCAQLLRDQGTRDDVPRLPAATPEDVLRTETFTAEDNPRVASITDMDIPQLATVTNKDTLRGTTTAEDILRVTKTTAEDIPRVATATAEDIAPVATTAEHIRVAATTADNIFRVATITANIPRVATTAAEDILRVATTTIEDIPRLETITIEDILRAAKITVEGICRVATTTIEDIPRLETITTEDILRVATTTIEDILRVATTTIEDIPRLETSTTEDILPVATTSIEDIPQLDTSTTEDILREATTTIEDIPRLETSTTEDILPVATTTIVDIPQLETSTTEDILREATTTIEDIPRGATTVAEDIIQAATTTAEDILQVVTTVSEDILQAATTVSEDILQVVTTVSEDILQAATTVSEDILQAATTVSEDILQAATTVSEDILQAAKTTAEDILQAATAAAEDISQTATAAAEDIPQVATTTTKGALRVEEPIVEDINQVNVDDTDTKDKEDFEEFLRRWNFQSSTTVGDLPYKSAQRSNPKTDTGNKNDPFAAFSSVDKYLDTWDRDLLNLDKELNPIPDFSHIDAMIYNLLDEKCSLDASPTTACCPGGSLSKKTSESGILLSEGDASFCLIISYPHGGSKVVSTGYFSSHKTVGGILYDTATCMGSCGAPIVALSKDVEIPYVTNFMHAGTIKVNCVTAGAGDIFFDQPLPDFV